jgi:hypothetical protein
LGICSRFADRGLSVFVIEGLPLPPIFLARAQPPRETRCSGNTTTVYDAGACNIGRFTTSR